MTKLQKVVDMVEDRHLSEAYMRFTSPKYKRRRPSQFRGSVMDATPAELDAIRRISVPMDEFDHGSRRNHYKDGVAGWKRWLQSQ